MAMEAAQAKGVLRCGRTIIYLTYPYPKPKETQTQQSTDQISTLIPKQ